MALFGRKTAEKLDTAAGVLYRAGRKAGGEKGGRVGDAIATTVLGPIRDRCEDACPCKDCRQD
ncbi:hypothetical protein OEIGOIKO_05778 [Streptomyces chrestomyceticus JCM 4735]|uniref:Uncharacterized protein n=1 Tax=Streptomyces chrestomyceticus JCM 4735 TaxID=1306181 RepID=A0A7U9L0G3_9ACTN|nr:hypothetical protein [Streptomyces chrestomyceticus]GCD37968.1 hypothetical protein OEIGOIKO_05778 [Streptomyces chrestomyceticus JCM 4735]